MSKPTPQPGRRLHAIGDRVVVSPHGVIDQIVGLWQQESPTEWVYMLRGRAMWWRESELVKPSAWKGKISKVYPVNLQTNCPTCGRKHD